MRLIGSIFALLGLCLVYSTGLWAGASERLGGVRASSDDGSIGFRVPKASGYSTGADVDALLQSWVDADPERVRLVAVAQEPGRAPVRGLEFASRPLSSVEDFPLTMLLIGGADGVSLVGGEAVLHSVHGVLSHLDELRSDVRVVAIPRCAPESLPRLKRETLAAAPRPWSPDEDLDGAYQEDPPDDLDGDGFTLSMLIEDPKGPWCLASDRRVLLPAGPRDAPRYRLTREGRDDDGDGLYNEDGERGTNWARTFPVGWRGPASDGTFGARPMEDPVTRAVADFILQLDPTVTLIFGGNHGGLRFFQGNSDGDTSERVTALRARLSAGFARATGRFNGGSGVALKPDGAAESQASGSLGDWLQTVVQGTVVEVAAWGPTAVWIDGRPLAASKHTGTSLGRPIDHSGDLLELGREPDRTSALWMRWLDDVHGGAGFVDWHPVDLGGGLNGLVGGWEPFTKMNPPEDQLAFCLEGLCAFVEGVAAALPRYEIELLDVTREGSLVRLRARVANRGAIEPLASDGPERGGLSPRAETVTLSLDAACDAAIVVGGARTDLGELRPGAVSASITWVLEAPAGGCFALRVEGPDGVGATREIRP